VKRLLDDLKPIELGSITDRHRIREVTGERALQILPSPSKKAEWEESGLRGRVEMEVKTVQERDCPRNSSPYMAARQKTLREKKQGRRGRGSGGKEAGLRW